MVISDNDKLTELNTTLNESMVFLNVHESSKPKSRKSITINTSITSPSKRFVPELGVISSEHKSILKNSKNIRMDKFEMDLNESNGHVNSSRGFNSLEAGNSKEPYRSLEEFVNEEKLILNRSEASFTLGDINEDDELFLIDIPRHLNPHDLVGVNIDFDSNKKKFKISNEKYCWVPCQDGESMTCVMATGKERKPFRAVNVKSSGKIVINRHKTSDKCKNESKKTFDDDEQQVDFPEDLKFKNPLFQDKVQTIHKMKKVEVKQEIEDTDED
ncbi:uncharacterized protein LOC103570378 [Microplitis demolitor]|uniref:uncharacterized protein LOC103570378 n=1 Tax=Microplitis demolitor TaxID=69319 RepID=UPI0006D51C6C|nr:uncharacterized protein LOC103570378 [Microplitis demolitor]